MDGITEMLGSDDLDGSSDIDGTIEVEGTVDGLLDADGAALGWGGGVRQGPSLIISAEFPEKRKFPPLYLAPELPCFIPSHASWGNFCSPGQ